MPEFTYEGIDKAGKKVKGKIEAPNEGELRIMLRGMGVRPIRLAQAGVLNQDLGSLLRGGKPRISSQGVINFTRQLNVLIGAGIPLVQALEILGEQVPEPAARTILGAIKEKVSGGKFFWESLMAYPESFPKIYTSLIRAGESSGALEQMLKRIARYMEDHERLKKLLRGAMTYPVIVVSVGFAVIFIMLAWVIPKFESLLTGSGQELPALTQAVIDASHFAVDYFFFITGGLGSAIFFAVRFLKTKEGRAAKDRLLFKLPIFGPIAQKGGIARFSRTMQTLLASGVNMIDAIDICKETIDNVVLEEAVSKIRGDVESGKTLGMVVSKLGVFPKMAVQMISVGETTGNLDKMLDRVADFYEAEVEEAIGNMTKLIEPVMLVFLGGSVGTIMLAMYMPIFKLAGGAE